MVMKESEETLQQGGEAPDFELQGTDGETYTLDSFADDDALLVVFTCNHCPYAKAKIDVLNEIAADYDDVSVVGINANDAEEYPDDSFERMVEVVEDDTVRYDAYLRDESQEVARAFGAVCTPDPFLFENDGGREALGASEGASGEPGEPRATFQLVYHGRLDDAPNPDDEPTHIEIRDAIDAVLADDGVEMDPEPSRGCSIKWK